MRQEGRFCAVAYAVCRFSSKVRQQKGFWYYLGEVGKNLGKDKRVGGAFLYFLRYRILYFLHVQRIINHHLPTLLPSLYNATLLNQKNDVGASQIQCVTGNIILHIMWNCPLAVPRQFVTHGGNTIF